MTQLHNTSAFIREVLGSFWWAVEEQKKKDGTESVEMSTLRLWINTLFVWFLTLESYISRDLFEEAVVCERFKNFDPQSSKDVRYIQKILKPIFKNFPWQVDIDDFANNIFWDANLGIISVLQRYAFCISEQSENNNSTLLTPEIIGTLFENVLAIISGNGKQNARVISGSYYTPHEIVEYIVDESLKAFLKPHIKPEVIDAIFQKPFVYKNQWKTEYETASNLLLACKILDPACGAGAFPLVLLDRLSNIIQNLNTLKNPYEIKLILIQNNIYGIDLQAIALDICKVRIYLDLLTSNKSQSLKKSDHFVFPKLDFNLINANSLVFFIHDQSSIKGESGCDIRFPSSFDIVLGNPPYGIKLQKAERAFYKEHYDTLMRNYDIYLAFFVMGLHLSNSIVCYITPDKWLSNNYATRFREKYGIPRLAALTHVGAGVFDAARVDAVISLFCKKTEDLCAKRYFANNNVKYIAHINKNALESPFFLDTLFVTKNEEIDRIEKTHHRLSEYITCDYAFASPQYVYALKPYIEDCSKKTLDHGYYKIINTGTIGKYQNLWGRRTFTYLKEKYQNPVIKIENLKQILSPSHVKRLIAPKIIIKGLNLLDACIDLEGQYIATAATILIRCENLRWLKIVLCILNSSLILGYLRSKYFASSWNGALRFNPNMFLNLPVPPLEDAAWDSILPKLDAYLTAVPESKESLHYLHAEIEKFVLQRYQLSS